MKHVVRMNLPAAMVGVSRNDGCVTWMTTVEMEVTKKTVNPQSVAKPKNSPAQMAHVYRKNGVVMVIPIVWMVPMSW